ncbi:MAG TPA: hypothetical protein VEL28_16930 [Candidatus Binatia bacterium]|nr:hypothetical protein [Candidatus Binatia bacterium]
MNVTSSVFFFVLGFLSLGVPVSGRAANGDCGQPSSNGASPTASDCLFILRTAVGSETCTPQCICAPKGTLPVTTTDALLCLKKAVGQNVQLNCPCDGTTTTSTTTTTAEELFECDVTFGMTSEEAIASLSFQANYQLVFGLFVGDGDEVECTSLADADFTFSNDHANKILDIGVTSAEGLAGPVTLAECVYATNTDLEPEDIRIQDVTALSPKAEPVDAEVEVVSVVCP